MTVDSAHAACVQSWLRATLRGSDSELVEAFAHAFDALLRTAEATLGAITLGAILDRVLHVSAERFPMLAVLRPEGLALRWNDLRERARDLARDQLRDGIGFAMTELLTVLGNLTADVLTPDLHDVLATGEQS
jgi:hypothetical protein